jgi:hypothetical protein
LGAGEHAVLLEQQPVELASVGAGNRTVCLHKTECGQRCGLRKGPQSFPVYRLPPCG